MDCEGCKYESCKANEWPCCECSRMERADMYEPAEETEN